MSSLINSLVSSNSSVIDETFIKSIFSKKEAIHLGSAKLTYTMSLTVRRFLRMVVKYNLPIPTKYSFKETSNVKYKELILYYVPNDSANPTCELKFTTKNAALKFFIKRKHKNVSYEKEFDIIHINKKVVSSIISFLLDK